MSNPTNTQKIDELTRRVGEHIPLAEFRLDQQHQETEGVKQRVKVLEDKEPVVLQRMAALEERCKSLEKNSDRTWQVWLALISAGVALVVSLLKK